MQKQLTLWRDLHEKWAKKKTIKSQLTAPERSAIAEAKLWVEMTEFIVTCWKEKEPDILQVHQYIQRGLSLLTRDHPPSKHIQESSTHFNMGINLLDQVTEKVKQSIQDFYLEKISSRGGTPSLGWSLDLLSVWSLTAFVSATFFGTTHKDFATSDHLWSTLLERPPHLLRDTLPPLLSYFFFSWAFYLDPVVVPSLKKRQHKTILPVSRFETQEAKEAQLPFDPTPFLLLPFIPCDIRLCGHVTKIPKTQLDSLNVHVYQYQWNHFAGQHFGLFGESKNFLGHELETTFPGSVKSVKDFQCVRFGILKFYLHHVAPLFLQLEWNSSKKK
jgi:hypothetical protein